MAKTGLSSGLLWIFVWPWYPGSVAYRCALFSILDFIPVLCINGIKEFFCYVSDLVYLANILHLHLDPFRGRSESP